MIDFVKKYKSRSHFQRTSSAEDLARTAEITIDFLKIIRIESIPLKELASFTFDKSTECILINPSGWGWWASLQQKGREEMVEDISSIIGMSGIINDVNDDYSAIVVPILENQMRLKVNTKDILEMLSANKENKAIELIKKLENKSKGSKYFVEYEYDLVENLDEQDESSTT